MNAGNKTYSAAELASYHAGTMTDDEMHLLEKAALEDPFLAEALEGYANNQDPEPAINELKEKIALRTSQRSRFFLYSRSGPAWLRIAAIFILFGGIGYVFYRLNENDDRTGLSQYTNQAEKAAPVPNSEKLPDTTSIVDSAVVSGSIPIEIAKQKAKDKNAISSPTIVSPAPPFEDAVIISADKNVAAKKTVTPEVKESKERVAVNNNGNNANDISRLDNQVNRQSNNAEAGSRDYYDRVANNNNRSAAKDENFKGVNSNDQSEIRATSPVTGQKTAEIANIKASPNKKALPTDSLRFIEYVEENLEDLSNSAGQPYEGIVILSFSVNSKGSPRNIKVVRSLCVPCDAQAISLLQKGPKWIVSGKTKRQVSIEF